MVILEVEERHEFTKLLEQYDEFPRLLNLLVEIVPPYAKEELILFICYVCEEYLLVPPQLGYKFQAQLYQTLLTITNRFEDKVVPNLSVFFRKLLMAEQYPTHQQQLVPELAKFLRELIELTIQMMARTCSDYLQEHRDSLKESGNSEEILS